MTDKAKHHKTPENPGLRSADAGGAIKTVFRILDAWEATPREAQQLLGIAPRTYQAWRASPPARPDRDKLERASYILGIWKALRILFPSNGAYRRWPRLANSAPLFAGKPPMDIMASGNVSGLYRVRAWLDGWRG
jgi:hypothetical protein